MGGGRASLGMQGTTPRTWASVADAFNRQAISLAPMLKDVVLKTNFSQEEKDTQEDSEGHLRAWV